MKTKKKKEPDIKVMVDGRYTIAQGHRFTFATYRIGQTVGEGIARWESDEQIPQNPEIGVNIAKSRAYKAWVKKTHRKTHIVHSMFQG